MSGFEHVLNNRSWTVSERYSQIVLSDDDMADGFGKTPHKQATADDGYTVQGDAENDVAISSKLKLSASSKGRSSRRARKDSRVSWAESEDIPLRGNDKREKYREKNRVAARKCRIKKRGYADQLEENHRTQSVANAALKRTEKSLRDELSFWRTQALRHTSCHCRHVQDYNMRKAQDLAAEGGLGDGISARLHERSPTMACIMNASLVAESPSVRQRGQPEVREQSVSGHGAGLATGSASSSTVAFSPNHSPSMNVDQESRNFGDNDAD
ncbi:hypothetical protein H2203_005212 [Taxawa tesnikishii (nom. ined.)]|nr:hypothetical protein H2203_005212 [Dothideales sp. JES 119]